MEGSKHLSTAQPLISDFHDGCVKSFRKLQEAIKDPVRNFGDQISPWKCWAGNVGAKYRDARYQFSLDHRLSEASFYKDQVLTFLKTLEHNIQRALELVEGKQKPAEEDVEEPDHEPDEPYDESLEDSPWELSDCGSDKAVDCAPKCITQNHSTMSFDGVHKPTAELPHTIHEINFIITCLYRLPLRHPASLDRFANRNLADISGYQPFDILYVRDKFPIADTSLATRLGKLVSRRRQLLAARSARDRKLTTEDTGGLVEGYPDIDTQQNPSGTLRNNVEPIRGDAVAPAASQTQLSGSRKTGMTSATVLRREMQPDGKPIESFSIPQSSFAPSVASSYAVKLRVRVPRRPRDSNGAELEDFKCPYCFIACHLESHERWKRHVLRDLQPYVCTFEGCELNDHMFDKRDEWFQHEMQTHRVEWACGQKACHKEGHHSDQESFLAHMSARHSARVDDAQKFVFLSMFERPRRAPNGSCSLCMREAENLKTHLAHHLEQVALFALPRENEGSDMASWANARGSALASPDNESSDNSSGEQSNSEFMETQLDNDASHEPSPVWSSSEVQADQADELLVQDEQEPSHVNVSWAEVYHKSKPLETEEDRFLLKAFEVKPGVSKETNSHIDQMVQKRPGEEPGVSTQDTPDDSSPHIDARLALLESLASDSEDDEHYIPSDIEKGYRWLLEDAKFLDWRDSKRSRLLWVVTESQGGGSAIARVLTESRPVCTDDVTSTVCSFSFKGGQSQCKRGSNALSALLHQLFTCTALFTHALPSYERYGQNLRDLFSELWEILVRCARDPLAGEIVCILDTLDGCEEDERMAVVEILVCFFSQTEFIEKMIGSSQTQPYESPPCRLKFLVTSLPNHDLRRSGVPPWHSTYLRFEEISKEIGLEIDARMPHMLGNFSDENRKHISGHLKEMYNCTYLWLFLTTDIIGRSTAKFRDINQRLSTLPANVFDAYERISASSSDMVLAQTFYHIIIAAARPLSLVELNAALTLSTRDCVSYKELRAKSWPPQKFQSAVRDICGLIFTINNGMVSLIHHTAREFLIGSAGADSSRSDPWRGCCDMAAAHATMFKVCVAYLDFHDLATEFRGGDTHMQSINENDYLFDYAAANWAVHYISQPRELVKGSHKAAQRLCDTSLPQLDRWLPIYCKKHFFQSTEYVIGWTSLIVASMLGLTDVVETFLSEGADVNAQGGHYGNALQAASAEGYQDIVQVLLEKGADVNIQGPWSGWSGWSGSALQVASGKGHKEVVQMLLDHGADVDIQGPYSSWPGSALRTASFYGFEDLVQSLLEKGADVNACSKDHGNALEAASANGHREVVRLLHDYGASKSAEEIQPHIEDTLSKSDGMARVVEGGEEDG